MREFILSGEKGEKHLLLGNEAIARGIIEAGAGFISCYPGTPSSELPDTLFSLSPKADYYFEYSPNEKVAMEVAGGAALAGVPAVVTMKHVGINVAADPLMTLSYIGTPGGLMILSADDPGCHSSQNEQDNRYYSRLGKIPCFEPATAQECKDMAKEALRLSAKWEQPVLLRTTTRVNHLRGIVEFDSVPQPRTTSEFTKNPKRFVPVPAVARIRHGILLENLKAVAEEAEKSGLNYTFGQGKIGVIASGVSRAYLHDALEDESRLDCRVLELGMTYPLPKKKIAAFIQKVEQVLILEELEPVVEEAVRAIAQKSGVNVRIVGKSESLSTEGEYSADLVRRELLRLHGIEEDAAQKSEVDVQALPQRPPNLCAGCPHRGTYYAVRKIFGDEAIYSSDIGCYTLGLLPPLSAADFLLCMGSSISAGCGMARAEGRPVVAFIGDSTFFHSGITGLINAVYNEYNLLVVILDNRTTAMTGHQPHPGVGSTPAGEKPELDIEGIVRGCGIERVEKVKPFNHQKTMRVLADLKKEIGVRVLITEEPCPLYARRMLGKKKSGRAKVLDSCEGCMECIDTLACPAFYVEEDKVHINPGQCAGCMLCVQICKHIQADKGE
ncbi:MAG: indolepyruvate ferredoxin oxidoreductase subunit alpha [Desulfonatronovibrionaceae bacterium]